VRARGIILVFLSLFAVFCSAQNFRERSFPQSASTLQSLLKNLPGGTTGSLPVLDGFVTPGPRSMEQYRRPYYQCTVRITAAPAGGSVVSVAAKITAWNSDPGHLKYEVLESNGRLESDLLDRLQELIASNSRNDAQTTQGTKNSLSSGAKTEPPPDISAPVRQLPSIRQVSPGNRTSETNDPELERQAKGLEDILRNQSHPTNLVAVKQEESPVLQNPSTDSTVLFLANAEDEFEVLTTKPDWVYVRISGLSRGWIRRSHVEILNAPDLATESQPVAAAPSASSGLFTISSEEVGSFPGQWAPLKGKSVRIISVQQALGAGHTSSPEDKLHFAEAQLKRVQLPASSVAGVVLIFDSEDGGMVAATRASLEQWKNGTVPNGDFWTQCYFDPPEILGSANRNRY
jgi:hypothetical protein